MERIHTGVECVKRLGPRVPACLGVQPTFRSLSSSLPSKPIRDKELFPEEGGGPLDGGKKKKEIFLIRLLVLLPTGEGGERNAKKASSSSFLFLWRRFLS